MFIRLLKSTMLRHRLWMWLSAMMRTDGCRPGSYLQCDAMLWLVSSFLPSSGTKLDYIVTALDRMRSPGAVFSAPYFDAFLHFHFRQRSGVCSQHSAPERQAAETGQSRRSVAVGGQPPPPLSVPTAVPSRSTPSVSVFCRLWFAIIGASSSSNWTDSFRVKKKETGSFF